MCLLVPGKIVKIEKDLATIDYGIERRKARIVEPHFTVGEYALVQGGVLVEKVERKEAEKALWLYQRALSQQG
ncbi:HypC/HybG/HupF family hydrogenase formation chaperone [Candidatus Woesearchaeota archaeon]|nr:HypC/HybG/HupF family hydrogenase formation chaperone [Candidatus Woesearchaeota archaeon]